ncbi:hypothetical protein ACS0TY_003300 [Phlomoides rotata]
MLSLFILGSPTNLSQNFLPHPPTPSRFSLSRLSAAEPPAPPDVDAQSRQQPSPSSSVRCQAAQQPPITASSASARRRRIPAGVGRRQHVELGRFLKAYTPHQEANEVLDSRDRSSSWDDTEFPTQLKYGF